MGYPGGHEPGGGIPARCWSTGNFGRVPEQDTKPSEQPHDLAQYSDKRILSDIHQEDKSECLLLISAKPCGSPADRISNSVLYGRSAPSFKCKIL